jgi:formamidopyrimidine-DNA glycosylase
MPELPDLRAYLTALERRVVGQPLSGLRIASPFVLRSVDPPKEALIGKPLVGLSLLGKRIVFRFEEELYAVIHLMVAGRFRFKEGEPGAAIPKRLGLLAMDFPTGALILTEASKKKRASLHLVRGEEGLSAFDRGGIDVLESDLPAFAAAISQERHTLKRAMTDQRFLSGIGNAYSDEILFRAKLSPFKRSDQLSGEEMEALHRATQEVMREWIDRLGGEAEAGFPTKVTAFREEMAVHGKHKQPCPVCEAPVQRIRYADNEANYCAGCQTEGRLLKDRSLSRLLKKSWPKTLEELEKN